MECRRDKRRTSRVKDKSTLVKNIPYGSGLAGGVRNKRWYERNRENVLQYVDWCQTWGEQVFKALKPGGAFAVFNSNRTISHIQVAMERCGFYTKDILIYKRSSGIPKGANLKSHLKKKGFKNYDDWSGWNSALRNEYEGIVLLQKPIENNHDDTYIKYGTSVYNTKINLDSFQSNILEGFSKSKNDKSIEHPTVKPYELMEHLVKMLTPDFINPLVVDPFAGSGTTLLAAKNSGFDYIGIEIEKEYVDIARKRLGIN